MNIVYISGSPRKNSNTDILLKLSLSVTGGEFIKLTDYSIEPCHACWACQKLGNCVIEDDMTKNILPLLLRSDGIVVGSPVYFNNVSAQTKAFIDRTFCIKGGLRNKIGGVIPKQCRGKDRVHVVLKHRGVKIRLYHQNMAFYGT